MVRTFKVCLPAEHNLRKSLTRKPIKSMRRLMIALMSISGSRRTSNKEKGRLRRSLRTEGIFGQIGIITADLGEILRDTMDQLLFR